VAIHVVVRLHRDQVHSPLLDEMMRWDDESVRKTILRLRFDAAAAGFD